MRRKLRIAQSQKLANRWIIVTSSLMVVVTAIIIISNLGKPEKAMAAGTETLSAGSYIINMGITPQTAANALKPYGLVYDLVKNYKIPVKWIIEPTKAKDGTDFTYEGVNYKGGPFAIDAEFIDANIASVIAAWNTKGVQGKYITSAINVPVYTTITSYPRVMIDNLSSLESIIVAYYNAAEIPSDAYEFGSPSLLTECFDLWTNPHGDPTWATHSALYNFVTVQKSFIWAECHSVSMMEACSNPSNSAQNLSFLSSQGLQCYQSGGNKCPGISESHAKSSVSPYTYNHHADPVMQFMGTMQDATKDGSEQWYIPATAGEWRTNVKRGVSTNSGSSPREGTLLVYGPAFGDPSNGYVMYEAGHDLLYGGVDAAGRVAAVRAYHNYVLLAGKMKELTASFEMASSVAPGGTANAVVYPTGGTPPYTYEWSTNLGTLNSTTYQSVLFTAPYFEQDTMVVVKAVVTDACNRQNIFYRFFPITGGSLPVELTSFSATKKGNTVDLKWATASEKDNDFFTVERSTSGQEFEPVIRVFGKGNTHTGHTYQVSDKNAPSGNIYYRLKQTDIDGTTTIYKTIQVKEGKTEKGSITNLGPNPFDDHFNITVESEEAGEITAVLYTQDGKPVEKMNFQAEEGSNSFTFYCGGSVKTGIYILKLYSGDADLGTRKLSRI